MHCQYFKLNRIDSLYNSGLFNHCILFILGNHTRGAIVGARGGSAFLLDSEIFRVAHPPFTSEQFSISFLSRLMVSMSL